MALIQTLRNLTVTLILTTVSPLVSYGSTIELKNEHRNVPLGQDVEYFQDATGQMTFEQVQNSSEFQKLKGENPSFGFSPNPFWFRFQVQKQTENAQQWYFSLENPNVDYVSIFTQNEAGKWVESKSGDMLPFAHRELKNKNFYFKIPASADHPTPLFVRLQTNGSADFKMNLKDGETLFRENHESQFLHGIFVGLIAIMLFYYTLLSVGGKSIEYFVFASFLCALLGMKVSLNGLGYEYLWPNSPWMANKSSTLFVPMIFFTATLNAYIFFPIRQHTFFKKLYIPLCAILGTQTLLGPFLPVKALKIYTLTGLLSFPLIIGSGIYFLLRGFKPARLYLTAWGSMIAGGAILALQKIGLMPVSYLSLYGVDLASSLLVVLMSVSLSDKLNQSYLASKKAQADKLRAEEEARSVIEHANEQLEKQVQLRTAQIEQQTRELQTLLNNLRQGVCSIDGKGSIHPQYSKFLEKILNQSELQGKNFFELLFSNSDLSSDQKEIIQSVIDLSIHQDRFTFDMNAHLLPHETEISSSDGSVRNIELEWATIEDGGDRILRVLASVRDVTDTRRAQMESAQKSRELDAIGRILEIPSSQFERLFHSFKETLSHCKKLLSVRMSQTEWNTLLREVHTLKGNARTYNLDDITKGTHQLENELFQFTHDSIGDTEAEKIRESLQKVSELVEQYERIQSQKLKGAKIAQIEKALQLLSSRLMDNWENLPATVSDRLRDPLHFAEQWNSNTFKKGLAPLILSLESLALQLNKPTPRVEFRGSDFLVDQDKEPIFEAIFLHLFRNSIDHGLPSSSPGQIHIQITHSPQGTELHYEDSGKGLNLSRLREIGIQKGLLSNTSSDQQTAELIFQSGLSTAQSVSEISGRGVGMEAVLSLTQELEGSLSLHLLGPSETPDCIRFAIRIVIPPQKKTFSALTDDRPLTRVA